MKHNESFRTLLLRTSFLAEHCDLDVSWLLIGVVVLVEGVPHIFPMPCQEHVVPRAPVVDPSVVLVSVDQKKWIFFQNLIKWIQNHFSYVVLFLLKQCQ
jgi:hypothetical protein